MTELERLMQKNRLCVNKIVKLNSQLHNIGVENARLKRALNRERLRRARDIRF